MPPEADQSAEEVADIVASGGTLSVVLNPDTDTEAYLNPLENYWETYSLPHVCLDHGFVWGATRKTHLAYQEGKGLAGVMSFFYTNAIPLYGNTQDDTDLASIKTGKVLSRLLSQAQYNSVRFIAHKAGPKIWSTDTPADTDALAQSIQRGSRLRIVFEDESNLVRSHPLDLCFLSPQTNDIKMMIEFQTLPGPFANPGAFIDALSRSVTDLPVLLANKNFVHETQLPAYPAFRRITQTGCSHNPKQLVVGGSNQVTNIALFEEVLAQDQTYS